MGEFLVKKLPTNGAKIITLLSEESSVDLKKCLPRNEWIEPKFTQIESISLTYHVSLFCANSAP